MLPLLDELFDCAGFSRQSLDAVAFGQGPGSFTGVRIAASVAQAVALAANATVVKLSSTLLMAASARRGYPQLERWVTAVRSHGDTFYIAEYARSPTGEWEAIQPPELCDQQPGWLAQTHGVMRGWVGEVPVWWETVVADGLTTPLVPPGPIDGGVMMEHARAAVLAGEAVPAEEALPLYLNGDSPFRKRQ